eukprot:tig00020927_g16005.t1
MCRRARRLSGESRIAAIATGADRGAALAVVLAVVAGVGVPAAVREAMLREIRFTEKAGSAYESWAETKAGDAPVYLKVYGFNVTNAGEVLGAGARPALREVGPYVYRMWSRKLDVRFEGDAVAYKDWTRFVFEPSLSAGPDSDTVTGPNIAYAALLASPLLERGELSLRAALTAAAIGSPAGLPSGAALALFFNAGMDAQAAAAAAANDTRLAAFFAAAKLSPATADGVVAALGGKAEAYGWFDERAGEGTHAEFGRVLAALNASAPQAIALHAFFRAMYRTQIVPSFGYRAPVEGQMLLVTRPVREWVFGYRDPLLAAVLGPSLGAAAAEAAAFVALQRNASDEAAFRASPDARDAAFDTGARHVGRVRLMRRFRGGECVPQAGGACVPVGGHALGSFAPEWAAEGRGAAAERLATFDPFYERPRNFCRAAGEERLHGMLPLYPFEPCPDAGLSLPVAGLGAVPGADMGAKYGAPVVFTAPHFCGAPALAAAVAGLACEPGRHGSRLGVEPRTGLAMEARLAVQGNVALVRAALAADPAGTLSPAALEALFGAAPRSSSPASGSSSPPAPAPRRRPRRPAPPRPPPRAADGAAGGGLCGGDGGGGGAAGRPLRRRRLRGGRPPPPRRPPPRFRPPPAPGAPPRPVHPLAPAKAPPAAAEGEPEGRVVVHTLAPPQGAPRPPPKLVSVAGAPPAKSAGEGPGEAEGARLFVRALGPVEEAGPAAPAELTLADLP